MFTDCIIRGQPGHYPMDFRGISPLLRFVNQGFVYNVRDQRFVQGHQGFSRPLKVRIFPDKRFYPDSRFVVWNTTTFVGNRFRSQLSTQRGKNRPFLYIQTVSWLLSWYLFNLRCKSNVFALSIKYEIYTRKVCSLGIVVGNTRLWGLWNTITTLQEFK